MAAADVDSIRNKYKTGERKRIKKRERLLWGWTLLMTVYQTKKRRGKAEEKTTAHGDIFLSISFG